MRLDTLNCGHESPDMISQPRFSRRDIVTQRNIRLTRRLLDLLTKEFELYVTIRSLDDKSILPIRLRRPESDDCACPEPFSLHDLPEQPLRVIIQLRRFNTYDRILQYLREFPMQLPGDKERTPIDIGRDLSQVIAVEHLRAGESWRHRPEPRPVDLHLVLLRPPECQILLGRLFIGEILF